MKLRKPHLLILIFAFCFISARSQNFVEVRDGIEYSKFQKIIDGSIVKMNLLRLDLSKIRIEIVHAKDSSIGTGKVSEIANKHRAFAAINAGFFRLDTSEFAGEASALLMIDKTLLSENAKDRILIGTRNSRKRAAVEIGRLNSETVLQIGNARFRGIGLNRECVGNQVVLYTPRLGTTFDPKNPIFFVKRGKLSRAKADIANLSADEFAIVACGSKIEALQKAFSSSSKASVFTTYSSESKEMRKRMLKSDDVVAGVPQLLRDGKIEITWEREKISKSFVETRHPRTAVAKLKDGKLLLVTVDGRSEESSGIDLHDLAEFLLSQDAIDALNLDGGGSTTMYLDGKIVNKPSDKTGERSVSDAILVFSKVK